MRRLACVFAAGLLGAQSPQEPARIQVFEAMPRAVQAGEPVELRWSSTGTDRVRLEPLEQELPPVGQVTYLPRERTVFWLHASNARGGQSIPLVVEMLPTTVPAGGRPGTWPQSSADGIWIQFAALEAVEGAERLTRELERLTGSKVRWFEIEAPGQPGRTLQRLRIGPFASIREARSRLRSLLPRLRSLQIKPIVAVD